MNINEVLEKVKSKIVPTKDEKEKIENFCNDCLKIVSEICKGFNEIENCMLVGSLARNTWLKEKKEFDIFILIKKNIERERFEKIGLNIGKVFAEKINGKFLIQYAEHPYVRVFKNEFTIDIVPCYKLEKFESIRSSVDRTPFHVKYLQDKINEEISSEIRLLKKFLLNNNLYGADSKTNGFSGFLTELLIIYYKTFLNLLKNAVDWRFNELIDIEKYYEKREDAIRKFKNNPLIVIDPIDKNRNCASALSTENFYYFKSLARKFLENPDETFFFEKPSFTLNFEEILKNRGTKFLLLKFERPNVIDEIVFTQLRSFCSRLADILQERKYEFKVIGYECFANEKNCLVFIEFEIFNLPKVQKKIGPFVYDEKNSKNFLEKYKNAIQIKIENNKWVALIKREFLDVREKIFDSLKESEEILLAKGIPSYIAKSLVKGFEIYEDEKVYDVIKNEGCEIILFNYFQKSYL